MEAPTLINSDPDILGGTPVFTGTRVPIWSLFVHLEKGISLEDFLDDFPTVERSQAIGVLEIANRLVSSRHWKQFYEIAA